MRRLGLVILICIALGFAIHAQTEDEDADITHVIVAGENLTSIANTYGLTVDEIATDNDLDPSAYLQVGQRLRIIYPVAEATSQPESTAVPASAPNVQVELEQQIVPKALANGLPDAPVAMADAPRQDLSLLDPEVCFALFLDENKNGTQDPGEELMPGGEISLNDGGETVVYAAEGNIDTQCIVDLQPQVYTISAKAPADYSLTSSASLRLDLREGGPLELYFGVTPGSIQEAQPVAAPPIELPRDDAQEPESLLGQISGLFVVGLAAMVLVSGFALSLFLRFR